MNQISLLFTFLLLVCSQAFTPISIPSSRAKSIVWRMTNDDSTDSSPETTAAPIEEMEEVMDAATKLALEKQKRADELRAQEVFMKRSTGIHKCSNCDWEYDEKKGDSFMIGGMIKPGTPFTELPSNWRCPTCRASKDNFFEVTEEIPGFEVNQGYGFGGNSMTSGQKSGIVFGGLFLFFLLFLAGYGLS